MNKIKLITILFASAMTVYSCSNTEKDSYDETVGMVSGDFDAKTSLDWAGTYSGTLPCADCEGIETELTLKEDGTYILTSKYLNNDDDFVDVAEGPFSWEGNLVKLGGMVDENSSPYYKVEENQLKHLDLKGNEVTGELASHYILSKNGNAEVEDVTWQLVELNGQPLIGTEETHYMIFHSKEGKVEAKANCNNLNVPYKITNTYQVNFDFEKGASTLMDCSDNTEQELIEVLMTVDNLTYDGKSLSLNKAKMMPLARFEIVD
ncbi:MAG TPA: copper resistance protein NlpE N-terminal domain-containing protein [Chitinophagales bacterium]|nr:copper resistance protein NlpE N-terminal domain-containing protein [Chitinophagales bacterium]